MAPPHHQQEIEVGGPRETNATASSSCNGFCSAIPHIIMKQKQALRTAVTSRGLRMSATHLATDGIVLVVVTHFFLILRRQNSSDDEYSKKEIVSV